MAKHILIAEDDELQGAILQGALRSRGYETDLVTDGLEAVRRLRSRHYDIALLDYHMPEVDGLAAARLLHDFLPDEDCPRLIATTAAAERLAEKDQSSAVAYFDAIVPKHLGLPALLSVVNENLVGIDRANAAAAIVRERDACRHATTLRRRRLLSPLAGLPGLAMAGIFVAAMALAAGPLRQVAAAVDAVHRTDRLGVDTAALVGAVQDAEASQRLYLATGAPAQRELFRADAERVDQLLVSPSSFSADGVPGFGASPTPQTLVEDRLRTLAEEAASRSPAASDAAAPIVAVSAGHETAVLLRDWAEKVVAGPRRIVVAGLAAIQGYVELVLVVLAGGVLFGLVSAGRATHRRWRVAGALAFRAPEAWLRHARPALTGP